VISLEIVRVQLGTMGYPVGGDGDGVRLARTGPPEAYGDERSLSSTSESPPKEENETDDGIESQTPEALALGSGGSHRCEGPKSQWLRRTGRINRAPASQPCGAVFCWP
jgi:hypothetical protein